MTLEEFKNNGYELLQDMKVYQTVAINFDEDNDIKNKKNINDLSYDMEIRNEWISSNETTYAIEKDGLIIEEDIQENEVLELIRKI